MFRVSGKKILIALIFIDLNAYADFYNRFDLNATLSSSFSVNEPETKLVSRSFLASGYSGSLFEAIDYQVEVYMGSDSGLELSKARVVAPLNRTSQFEIGVDYLPAAGFSGGYMDTHEARTSIYFRKFKPYSMFGPAVVFGNKSVGDLRLIALKDVNNETIDNDQDYSQILKNNYYAEDGVLVPSFIVEWQIQYGKFFPYIQFSSYDRNYSRYIAASLEVHIARVALRTRMVNDARYIDGIAEGLPNIVRILERFASLSYRFDDFQKASVSFSLFHIDAPESLRSILNLREANPSESIFWDDLSENGESLAVQYSGIIGGRVDYYLGARQMTAKYFIDESRSQTEKRIANEYFIGISGSYF